MENPFAITDSEGWILERFTSEQERDEALLTGDYPEDAEPAFINELLWLENPPGVPDCGDPGPDCVEHDGRCD